VGLARFWRLLVLLAGFRFFGRVGFTWSRAPSASSGVSGWRESLSSFPRLVMDSEAAHPQSNDQNICDEEKAATHRGVERAGAYAVCRASTT
jgi:hypothetical protein